MRRFVKLATILLVVIFCKSAYGVTNLAFVMKDGLKSELTKTEPDCKKYDNNGDCIEYITSKTFKTPIRDAWEIGTGLAAISINFKSSKIALFDSISPITVTHNYNQETIVNWKYDTNNQSWKKPTANGYMFAWSVGITASKPHAQSGVDSKTIFGLSVAPFLIRYGEFAIGIGVDWRNEDDVKVRRDRLNLTIPLSYQF